MKNIALDLGYGFTKILMEGSSRPVVIPTVVGESRSIKYKTDVSENKNSLKDIVVNVHGDNYFVGDLANRQSDIVHFTLDEDRFDEKATKIMAKAALAIASSEDTFTEQDINVVTGLPVTFYSNYKNKLETMISDTHAVGVSFDRGDSFVTKKVNVDKVKTIPQPFGSLFKDILDEEGGLRDEDMAKSKVGIIDVGFLTSDFVVANKLEYIDNMSKSTKISMNTAYGIINNELEQQYGVSKPIYQLEGVVREGAIKIKGKKYDIRPLIEYAYRVVAEKVIAEAKTIWPNMWELDVVILSGGGGAALSDHITPKIENSVLIPDSQSANVEGYLKLAKRLW